MMMVWRWSGGAVREGGESFCTLGAPSTDAPSRFVRCLNRKAPVCTRQKHRMFHVAQPISLRVPTPANYLPIVCDVSPNPPPRAASFAISPSYRLK